MTKSKQLKQQIAKLTGHEPVSDDERYLAQRLKDIEASRAEGELRTPTSISLTGNEREAMAWLAERHQCNNSEIVRRALRELAIKHGAPQRIVKQLTKGEQ